jgi:hypothetical protein
VTGFEDRLNQAIQRGKQRQTAHEEAIRAKQYSEEELKRLHSQYRLKISDHIEACFRKLCDHFPGFQVETLYGDRGWGAACYRDDISARGGSASSLYSRLEIAVRPYSEYKVIDLTGKGTVLNKEIYKRNFFQEIADVDVAKFMELVDVWTLEYAEMYAART